MIFVGKRIIVRDFRKNDAKSLVENANDFFVSRYAANLPYPYTLKYVIQYINKINKSKKEKPRILYEFGIELNEEKKVIGMICLARVNKRNKKADIGYWLGRKYWNKRIMSEALLLILKFAFIKLKLNRLYASVIIKNKASAMLLKKFNFKMIRKEKQNISIISRPGKIFDSYLFCLFKKNWATLF